MKTAKLTKPQRAVMIWMSRGWKAYSVGSQNRVEINGHRVCNIGTMESLERAGYVTKLGVSAWEPTDAARQWTDPGVA